MTIIGASLALPGCDPPPVTHSYRVLSGAVIACHTETGELTVRLSDFSRRRRQNEDRVHCVITRDSEVYVNDRFATLSDIALGDQIEVIGYRDPQRRIERFVVSYAYVKHPLPPPRLPAEIAEPSSIASGG